MSLKGIVLAGGKSSRFGEDKALAKAQGMTLIEKSVLLLKEIDPEPLVITSATRDYSFLDCRVERDIIPEKGPLGGLYTASQVCGDSSLLVLTCDMPNVTTSALHTLAASHKKNKGITLFRVGDDQWHPFPGVYEASLGAVILKAIERYELSMHRFIRSITPIQLTSYELKQGELHNVNAQEDLPHEPFPVM